jgi:hypothetical protein
MRTGTSRSPRFRFVNAGVASGKQVLGKIDPFDVLTDFD